MVLRSMRVLFDVAHCKKPAAAEAEAEAAEAAEAAAADDGRSSSCQRRG